MAQHTKHPWIDREPKTPDTSVTRVISDEDGFPVALIVDRTRIAGHPNKSLMSLENKYNAKVIKSAPKLLSTCIETRSNLITLLGLFGGGPAANEIFRQLNEAIREATGDE
jgi:hypothetical protein